MVNRRRDNEDAAPGIRPEWGDSTASLSRVAAARVVDGKSGAYRKTFRDESKLARESTFDVDDLVAFRYRIVELIARGGMGEVYEAEDLELGERVALKVVRRERAERRRVLELFKREIYLARKVTHPNVCRIFDVGFHVRADAPEPKRIPFFTMELLDGETLAMRLHRQGALEPEDALPHIVQMIDALGAAHAAGIIHRDFKCANVFLESASGGGERVIVTDFGLAKRAIDGGDGPEYVKGATGRLMGTPAYMAPEQLECGPVSPATDIYALGVVMYEMLTGARPFTGELSLGAAIERVNRAPPRPREVRPDLDPAWEAVILRCLARSPADRYASVGELAMALPGYEATGRTSVVSRPASHRLSLRMVAVLAALTALGVFGLRMLTGPQSESPDATAAMRSMLAPLSSASASASSEARRRGAAAIPGSVAILGFANLSKRPESNWVSTALSEVLATDLAAGEHLRVSPAGLVARMRTDLSLGEDGMLSKDALGRVRRYLGCDVVVLGSYLAERGAKWRVDVRVLAAETGETLASVSEMGTPDQALNLFASVSRQLRAHLGIGPLPLVEQGRVRRSLPREPEAARHYAEGLHELRNLNALDARDRLERAIAIEPSHALSHTELAEAFRQLGYGARALTLAKQAYSLSTDLTREEKLLVEGRYREAGREWTKAAEVYRTLFEFFPSNIEYGLSLARSQQNAGKPDEAFATLAKLREVAPPGGVELGVDEAEAEVAIASADYPRAEAAAARAAALAEARGMWHRAAENKRQEWRAYASHGKNEEAHERRREAIALYERAGDRLSRASALFLLARERAEDGDFDAARRLYQEAERDYRELGDKRMEATACIYQAQMQGREGKFRDVRALAEQWVSIAGETGNPVHRHMGWIYIADALANLGDLDGAADRVRQVLDTASTAENSDEQDMTAHALAAQAEILRSRGDIAGASKLVEKARERAGRAGSSTAWMDDTLVLKAAQLVLDDGRANEAEHAVADLLAQRPRLASREFADAHLLRARALLASNQVGRAREALERSSALPPSEMSTSLTLGQRIVAARLADTPADAETALRTLEEIIARTQVLGFFTMELEARLAAGELEIKAGHSREGRARLRSLEKDARAKGYGLWAHRAAKAAR